MAGRDGEQEHLWYHGTEDPNLTEFRKLKDAPIGSNGLDMGKGTYLTQDRSLAEEWAFRGGNGPGADVPEPYSPEREEWRDATANGRVLSVQFQPKNPAQFDNSRGAPDRYKQAKQARKAGHDAIVGNGVAVSFKPHKNAPIVKSLTYQDLDWAKRSPEQVAQEADEDQQWRW